MKKTTAKNRPIRRATEDMLEFAPMMTPGQEAAAWRTYWAARDAGDVTGAITARNHIVEANLRLVTFSLKKFPGIARAYASRDDAFQIGALALMRAVDCFEPDRESGFPHWAITCIRRGLQAGREKPGAVGRTALAIIAKESGLFYALKGYRPNEAELLKITGLSADHVRHGLAWGRKLHGMSLDMSMGDTDKAKGLAQLVADKRAVGPCDFLRVAEAEVFLRRIMAGLKPLYRKLLWLRFAAGWSLTALGDLCGTSRQYVEQLVQTAISKLQRVYTRAYRLWAGIEAPTREQREIVSRWLRNV